MSRDYGKVRGQFWASDDIRSLSVPTKFLGLYLLTSPHTNAIGCFRLPIAYILHDTGMDAAGLEAALAELRAAGFALPCERAPWIYIPNYLKHNPPENPNVWRKCVKELEALPGEITAIEAIAAELLGMADEERMCRADSKSKVSDEERNKLKRYWNGFDTVSKGQRPLPYPKPIPEPEPIRSSAPAVADATSKPKVVRGERWPKDQAVPRDWLSEIEEKFRLLGRSPPDFELEAVKFANHWASKSGKDATKLDWRKTFENWCLNARPQRSGNASTHEKFAIGAYLAGSDPEETEGRDTG